ncbi:MAG: putative Prepilin peptidase [Candidatus Peribacteria bacterium]|nr:putative Prepilin peptidase [Candidatus Peribacteria bacterium]
MLSAMTAILTPELVLTVLFILLGLCMGSFGNVLIFRLPQQQSVNGRSHCMRCNRVLHALELVPVFSFLALRGRCRTCKVQLSWQYPLVELGSALLFLFAILEAGFDPLRATFTAVSLWLLFLIAITDARTSLIPDALNLPLLIVGVVAQLVMHTFDISGILLGAGFFALQWLISRGKWVGSGDILLGAGIGALLVSWRSVVIFLFFSYVIGAAVASVFLLTRRKTLQDSLPFGPFLVFGAFLTLVFGQAMSVYLVF